MVLRIIPCISSNTDACICLYYGVKNPHTVITALGQIIIEYRTMATEMFDTVERSDLESLCCYDCFFSLYGLVFAGAEVIVCASILCDDSTIIVHTITM